MKLALLSDIHANVQALDACLEHAWLNGCDRFALLGDFVGYGGDPGAVMQKVMALAEGGAVVVRGNHDAMAVDPPAQPQQMGDSTARWTHEQLTPPQREFLATLPLTATLGPCLLVHASADAPEKWRYVEDERSAGVSLEAALQQPGIRYVFGGHVHQQTLYYRGSGRGLMAFKPTPGIEIPTPGHRQWIATVGSVGQPRDGQPTAMYAVFDVEQARLCFQRIPYDHAAAAASVRRAGLPEFFAKRLEQGR